MILHTACRVCGGELEDLLFLGSHPLPDFSQPTPEHWEYAPLMLTQCQSCSLMQMRHTVDRAKLFSNYWYKSGLSETMVAALKEVAEKANEFIAEGHTVVDIGSNDGTFFDQLTPGLTKIGFEPSDIPLASDKGFKHIIHDFFSAKAFEDAHVPSAKLVTSIAMFYSVEDPPKFVEDVATILLPGGVWINQMNDMTALYTQNSYDIIGHEHTCIWSLHALKFLLDRYGLEVFRVERIPLNGGTARFYIQHKGQRPIEDSVAEQEKQERFLNPIKLSNAIDESTSKLHDLMRRLHKEGSKVYIYGASTRGVTIVHAASLDEMFVQGAAERDESKVGKLFPGTRIPIVSERDMRIAQPDYLLALPYSYLPQFRKREREWEKNRGRWIIPVPQPRIL